MKVHPRDRGYCSHLLIPFHKCRAENWPFLYRCGHQRHEYQLCDIEDQSHRVKEWERERRLRIREKAKLAAKEKTGLFCIAVAIK